MATKQKIHQIVTLLSTLPNCPIIPSAPGKPGNLPLVLSMFEAALLDLPDEYVEAAYLQYINSSNPFFPSNPGVLRELAFDLEMIALGVPSSSEAWAIVMRGPSRIEARLCKDGFELNQKCETPDISQYWNAIWEYRKHLESCDFCSPVSREGSYGSAAVDEAVRRMGGRDLIFTDNAVADRARFQDSYRDLVVKERGKLQMHPEVRKLVESDARPQLAGGAMSLLAAKMSGGGK